MVAVIPDTYEAGGTGEGWSVRIRVTGSEGENRAVHWVVVVPAKVPQNLPITTQLGHVRLEATEIFSSEE